MKEFNLTDYRCNPDKIVVDENSNPVKIIYTDFVNKDGFNCVLIKKDIHLNEDFITRANENGLTVDGGQLFFASKTLEKWISVYEMDGDACAGRFYESKEAADNDCNCQSTYIGAFEVNITID